MTTMKTSSSSTGGLVGLIKISLFTSAAIFLLPYCDCLMGLASVKSRTTFHASLQEHHHIVAHRYRGDSYQRFHLARTTSFLFLAASSTIPASGVSNTNHTGTENSDGINYASSSASLPSGTDDTKQQQQKSRRRRIQQHQQLDMPWNDIQEWALRDQLPKYTVQVYMGDDDNDEDTMGKPTMNVYILWRTLAEEVTELSGYPIPFLIEKYEEMMKDKDQSIIPSTTMKQILPYLNSFEFTASGGIRGQVYGVMGVADGTQIETTPVGNVETTIPKGFVRTKDGTIYELGYILQQEQSSSSISGPGVANKAKNILISSANAAANQGQRMLQKTPEQQQQNAIVDPELVNVASLTAIVVGAAYAIETLSHHLTVNVFWV